MAFDIWFTRHNGYLWFIWAAPDEPPMRFPRRAENVRAALDWLRKAGIKVGQVGIADGEMLGLA